MSRLGALVSRYARDHLSCGARPGIVPAGSIIAWPVGTLCMKLLCLLLLIAGVFIAVQGFEQSAKAWKEAKTADSNGDGNSRENIPASGAAPDNTGSADPANLKLTALLSTPITFYGKVIDQYGAPVPQAAVVAVANDHLSELGTERTMKSDAAGLFTITGMHGLALGVDVSKSGYYRVNPEDGRPGSTRGVSYADQGGGRIYHPEENNPMVFALYKHGEIEPLDGLKSSWTTLQNGASIILDLTQEEPARKRKVKVTAWSDDIKKNKEGVYDWRYEIQPVEGKIQRSAGKFDFIAPEAGYHPMEMTAMTMDMPPLSWNNPSSSVSTTIRLPASM